MALSRTAKFYRKNKKSRDSKKKYDTALNARPEQKKKRAESQKARRKAKRNGKNVNGLDFDHGSKSFIPSSKNRGKRSGTKGDRNARGKK